MKIIKSKYLKTIHRIVFGEDIFPGNWVWIFSIISILVTFIVCVYKLEHP
jgi:hypothetical protein